MKSKIYHLLFIGSLLVFFSLQIGPVTILPDIVGYLVVGNSVSYLLEGKKGKMIKLTRLLIGVLIIGSLIPQVIFSGSEGYVFLVVMGVAQLIVRYMVLEIEINDFNQVTPQIQDELGPSYISTWSKRQQCYIVLSTAGVVGFTMSMHIGEFIFLYIAMQSIAEIYWLVMMYRLKKTYKQIEEKQKRIDECVQVIKDLKNKKL